MRIFISLILCFISVCSFTVQANAAACCGSSGGVPSLISGDDEFQLGVSISQAKTKIESISADGIWSEAKTESGTRTLKIDFASMLTEFTQIGILIPITQKYRQDQSQSGVSDLAINLGYEILPELNYNPWKPKGIAFIQLILPTGKSIHRDDSSGLLDNRGKEQWGLASGLLLKKARGPWDGLAALEVHHLFSASFRNQKFGDQSLTLTNGFGYNALLSLGFSKSDYRIAPGIQWTYEDPVQFSGYQNSVSLLERSLSFQLNFTYSMNDTTNISLLYADQSLLGAPVNTSLSQTLSVNFNRVWPL